jgi:hypothetical protein
MECNGIANMATDAPGSGARGSRDGDWGSYVPCPPTIDHVRESNDKAKALHEALGNAEKHVGTVSKAAMALATHKDSVVYVSVVVSVHGLQRH